MAADYYADAIEISAALAAEGRSRDAEAIRATVNDGSTATEILMGIRWHLRKLVDQKIVLRRETAERVTRLLTQLDIELSS